MFDRENLLITSFAQANEFYRTVGYKRKLAIGLSAFGTLVGMLIMNSAYLTVAVIKMPEIIVDETNWVNRAIAKSFEEDTLKIE